MKRTKLTDLILKIFGIKSRIGQPVYFKRLVEAQLELLGIESYFKKIILSPTFKYKMTTIDGTEYRQFYDQQMMDQFAVRNSDVVIGWNAELSDIVDDSYISAINVMVPIIKFKS